MAHDPSAFIQEYFRIRKTDGQGLNAAFDGGDPAENTNTTIGTGVLFRIRFKVRETAAGSDSTGFKIQVKRNAGSFVDLDVLGGSTTPAVLAVLSTPFNDGDATNVELLTSTTTDVDGDGNENLTSGTLALTSEETELEWCLQIMSFHDGPTQNIVNDTLEFRVVEADGTLFTGTYTNPVITVTETAGYIGGVFCESPNRVGPHVDSNGNLYVAVEPTATGGDSFFFMLKSSDGGDTWREMDSANRPTTKDLESVDIDIVTDTMHIAHMQSGANDVVYHRFRMSDHATNPDTWEITDELISAGAANDDQSAAIIVRSDGTIVAFYQKTDGTEDIKYRIRSTVPAWGGENDLDTAANNHTWVSVVKGDSDLIHIVYKDNSNGNVLHKSLNSSNSLSAPETVHDDAGTGTSDEKKIPSPPVYWNDGNEKIMVIVHDESDTLGYSSIITNDGSPAAVVQASDSGIDFSMGGGSLQSAACVANDGATVYLLYGRLSDGDLYLATYESGSWGTDALQQTLSQVDWVVSQVFTHSSGNGGATVLGYIYDNDSNGEAGQSWYGEYVIAAGGAFTLTADLGSYTLAGLAADLPRGLVLVAAQGSYTLAGLAANLPRGFILTAEQGAFTLSGLAAGLAAARLLTADQGSYSLTGLAANLNQGFSLVAAQGSYTLSGLAAELLTGFSLTADLGSYTLTGLAAGLTADRLLTAEQGSYALSGLAADLQRSLIMAADQGSYTITGLAADLLTGFGLIAEQGSYTITGLAAGLTAIRTLVAEQGSYTLSGQAVNLPRGLIMVAAQGSYTFSGLVVDLPVGFGLIAEQGSYILSGLSASLITARIMTADQGSYTLSGLSASLISARIMAADQGSYTLSGQAASLLIGRYILAAQGSYAITGQASNLLQGFYLGVDQGSFSLTGLSNLLDYSGVGRQIYAADIMANITPIVLILANILPNKDVKSNPSPAEEVEIG